MVRVAAILFLLVFFPLNVFSKSNQYDIAYLWDSDLKNILDYRQQFENLFGPDEIRHLRIVGRSGKEYGIVYDLKGTALSSAQLMVQHSEMLRQAGLSECYAIEDKAYYQLYNVSYGLGPNLEALKKVYNKVYSYLGEEVGKDLYIVQTGADNYSLIYRRMGDRASTYKVAKRHGKMLKSKGFSTSIVPETNNPIVFGESSHLDDAAEQPAVLVVEEVTIVPEVVPPLKAEQPITLLTPRSVKKTFTETPSVNLQFEKNIEEFINELRRKGNLNSNERTGWVVYDMSKNEHLVNINADEVFQAASMIKPFVSLAFFHQVKHGSLKYGPKSRKNMEAMIQYSNNASTNWIMKMTGGPARCEEILRTHYSHIFKNTAIKEYIPPGGKTYKNSALPSDYVRFLLALWNDELPYSKEMRRLMSLPGRDRLYDGTPIPQGTLVYNKTGSTAHLCGDMGILVLHDKAGKRYPYAIVGIIEQSSRPNDYGHWMRTRGDVIRQVSTLVYEEMKNQYRF
jgi:beta-lactamase class A